jgi:hypothetical protein
VAVGRIEGERPTQHVRMAERDSTLLMERFAADLRRCLFAYFVRRTDASRERLLLISQRRLELLNDSEKRLWEDKSEE